jgi:hypothetical protein
VRSGWLHHQQGTRRCVGQPRRAARPEVTDGFVAVRTENQQVQRPSEASELLDRVAVLGVRLDAQLPYPVPRLDHFIIIALLEMPRIEHMEAGYGMERGERGVALGGERPRHGEEAVASWRATVGDADRLQ